MRIGLFIGTLYGGGAERAMTRLSKILAEEHAVFVILCEDTYMEYDYAGTLINLNIKDSSGNKIKKIINITKRIFSLKKIKKEYKLDVVISFLDSPNIVNALSNIQGCKSYLSVRNFEFGREHSYAYEILMGLIYRKCDKVIPVSEVISNRLKRKYCLEPEQVQVLYNPYDITEIQNDASEVIPEDVLAFIQDSFVFVAVGRLSHQKGYWHLLKSFSLVKKSCPNAKLMIVGQGEQECLLKKLTDDLSLSDSVLFTGFSRNPYALMAKSKVFILSSLFEGFPNALVEAMACGLPVIAVDCESGPREILMMNVDFNKKIECVEEQEFGIITPSLSDDENWDAAITDEREQELAKAMELLYRDEQLRIKLAVNAKSHASKYGYKEALDRLNKIVIAK